jgi:tRNA pseudouridine55 synthase
MDGFLVINKPVGISSNKILTKFKYAIKDRKQKIGHLGTLDPLASGVLPIALGNATKAIPYIQNTKKIYETTINWGQQTSTDDTEGEVIKTSDLPKPNLEQIKKALEKYKGEILQTPPIFSACKINGKRAYALARQGEEVTIQPKKVTISNVMVLNDITLLVECSAGTYIRSLVRDLGIDLGCYAHCREITRLASGQFDLSMAIDMEDFENLDIINQKMISINDILIEFPKIALNDVMSQKIQNGINLYYNKAPFKDYAIVTNKNKAIAIVKYLEKSQTIIPVRVF